MAQIFAENRRFSDKKVQIGKPPRLKPPRLAALETFGLQLNNCFARAMPCPFFPWFFGFYQGKLQNYQGFSVPTKPTKSLEKTEKTPKLPRKFLE